MNVPISAHTPKRERRPEFPRGGVEPKSMSGGVPRTNEQERLTMPDLPPHQVFTAAPSHGAMMDTAVNSTAPMVSVSDAGIVTFNWPLIEAEAAQDKESNRQLWGMARALLAARAGR